MQKQINSNSLSTKENSTKIALNTQDLQNENTINLSITEFASKKQKQNICNICNKPFSTLGNMRNHIMVIHQNYRPFKCTYPGCNKNYSIESRYQIHLRTHIGSKPFICQICNKSFNEKGNLKTHLRFHSEIRPYKCPHCNKSYKTNGHLKDHIEILHNLIKKYICKFCNKKFGRISTLKAHIKTHTGEKNYKCKIEGCDKYFAEKGNMEIHYRRHLKKLNKNDINEKIKKKYGKKNIVNIGNENQNFFDSLAIYPLNQEFHQNDFFQQNKIDNLFNKERNYIDIDISNSITRPCSKSNLCMNKKPDNIFAKDEDLFSDEEDFSQGNNNYKNINDNSYMSDNYDFLDNKQNYKNEIGINNFNYNFNEINEANNSLKYQGQLEFLDKNYII